jgi:cellulose synthase operon protein C
VSQRSTQHQERLLYFVGELQLILPRLRVVISGRGMHVDADESDDDGHQKITGPVDALAKTVKPLELKELSEAEAISLLDSLGSPSARINKAIVKRVGGHPLSLRLSAQLVGTVAKKLEKPAAELSSADLFGDQWLAHMSEGMLYRRIIAHIPDVPLQKLADPGLVLRELTADIIFSVLNEPCCLELRSSNEADALFERLKQFNQLVSVQSATVVRHRPELRQRVLKEMMHGQLPLCRDIWLRAANFYKDQGDGRAEEMYCRLMLDEDPGKLAARWEPSLEKSLLKSRAEMPVRARQFLDLMALTNSGRLHLESETAGELDLVLLAEEMKLLLSRGSANAALDLFRATTSGRVPRYDSILYPVHVRAIAQSGDLDTAMAMALKALDRLEGAGKTRSARYEELLLLCCQVTRAQHAAKAGTLRLVLRRVLRRGLETIPAGKLVERFMNVDFHGGEPESILRLAIALLELMDVEAGGSRSVDPGGAEQARMCALRGLDALRKLGPDYFSIDGGLLVRSLAWLSTHFTSAPEMQQLLGVPQVMATLHRNYGESLRAYFAKRENEFPVELVARLGEWTVETSGGFDVGTVTEDQLVAIGAALRVVIDARDTAQGSPFARRSPQ